MTMPKTLLGSLFKFPRSPKRRYYQIVGGHTGEVIGVCTDLGVEGVREEEPGAILEEISAEEYMAFVERDY